MHRNYIKLFTKNEGELVILIQTMRIYSQDIGMEFGIEKYAMLIMKNEKRPITEGIELPNQERIRTLGENAKPKYLGVLKVDISRMKGKILKCLIKMRKRLKTKFCSRNLIKGIDSQVVSLVRYWRSFLKWTKEELRQMDQRTRKLMTMYKALHPKYTT